MTKNIALATYGKLPDLKDDDLLVIDHLLQYQIKADPLVWDSHLQNLDRFDCVVIRSCWDYHLRHQEFLDRAKRVEASGIALWNPARVIEWNLNKTYLRELARQGIATPPTVWLDHGSQANLHEILADRSWNHAVIKPTISATAHQTWITSPETAPSDQRAFEELLGKAGVMVQRFVEEIRSCGEWSFMFFGNRYSHAVLKRAKAGDFRVQDDFGGYLESVEPSPSLVVQAKRILEIVGEKLLYARVDGVEVDGEFQLMELELIEPVLFLSENEMAPQRFADAIAAVL